MLRFTHLGNEHRGVWGKLIVPQRRIGPRLTAIVACAAFRPFNFVWYDALRGSAQLDGESTRRGRQTKQRFYAYE